MINDVYDGCYCLLDVDSSLYQLTRHRPPMPWSVRAAAAAEAAAAGLTPLSSASPSKLKLATIVTASTSDSASAAGTTTAGTIAPRAGIGGNGASTSSARGGSGILMRGHEVRLIHKHHEQ